VLPTRSLIRFVRAIGWFPRPRSTRFRGWSLSDCRTWREGVLSLKHQRCNETKKYHRAQQSPHENDWLPGNENVHGRTSGDEEQLTITTVILRKPSGISWTSCQGSSLRITRPSRTLLRISSSLPLTKVLLNLFLSLGEFGRFDPERIGDPHPFEETRVSSTLFDQNDSANRNL
jgi:hypothetical protein